MKEFLESKDFMKLGYAINGSNWQMAMMILQRMSKKATELEAEEFVKKLTQIRLCVASRNKMQALNALTLLTALRVRRLKELKQEDLQ